MGMAETHAANYTNGQTQAAERVSTVFTNRDLFSGYYLGTLLAREVRTRQGETGARMPVPVRRRLQRLWDDVSTRFGNATGYTRTRQTWLDPLLLALGYEPLDEARAADFGEEHLPSGYLLYRPAGVDAAPAGYDGISSATPLQAIAADDASGLDDIDADVERELTDHPPATPGAVLLSLLAWGDDFDRSFATARRRSETPHKLTERMLASGPAMWGILLNGQKMRLLKRNVVAGRQRYLEVDLDALFDGGSDRDFDTFWTIFRAQAFEPDETGRCLLDVIDEGSRTHAERVSVTLKNSVFSAMERLMSALVERAQEIVNSPEVDPTDAVATVRRQHAQEALSNLRQLYEQSLVLLYRMLFGLYAESRELLPTDNPIYRDSYSLEPLRDEVERPGATYEPDSFRLWETIQALFRLIHYGCRTTELVVPAYNGDLFHPASTSLLNALRVPDDALAEVLRLLSLTPATKDRGRERISYLDLGVEQLGAVYEGLLEFEPRVATEPMIEVQYKDQLAVIPEREQRDYTIKRHFTPGQFYLGRGAGRKTTGSYYTPQPLVDFLVRRTLGPLVEGKTPDEILELKVVDPAMGSGAFLVGACLFLAEAYAQAIQREQPIAHAAIGDIELNASAEVSADTSTELSEEATRPYRRLVAERCIYGVDLNPMAVELAKVSLWLTTLAGDKPLTFLDAHLRCGNSLIGAPLHPWTDASGTRHYTIDTIHPDVNKRLQKGRSGASRAKKDDGRQPRFFTDEEVRATVEPLVGRLAWIAATPSDTIERVHEKETLYRQQVEGDRQRMQLKAVCDLWVASWFWHQPPEDAKPDDPRYAPPLNGPIYRQLVEYLRGRPMTFGLDPARYVQEARRVVGEVRPSHWELEFPEIFFDADGTHRKHPGFDAIVGNPPWDTVKPNSREFFSAYDPGFRELERQQAERRQTELLHEEQQIAATWENHVAELNSQADFFRLSELYPWQRSGVEGKFLGIDDNTYRLFIERAHQLLRLGGRAAMIVKAGIYKDQGATGLRQLLLDQSKLEFLYALSNERWVFPAVHHAERFALVGFTKGMHTRLAHVNFAINSREAISPHVLPTYLNDDRQLLTVPTSVIRRLSPDTLSLMEFRSQTDIDVIERLYGQWPLLGDDLSGGWNVDFTREFRMPDDRALFNEEGRGWPLYEGKMIYQYTSAYAAPNYWVEAELGRAELVRREIQRVEWILDEEAKRRGMMLGNGPRQQRVTELMRRLGRGPLSEQDICIAPESYRAAFRAVASNTNERTLIASIIPKTVFFVHSLFASAPWSFNVETALERPHNLRAAYTPVIPASTLAYLCALFNSFVLDFVLRFKVSSNVSQFYVYQLPMPRLMPGDPQLEAIAERVGRLVCVGPEFDELRRELLGDVNAHVATDEDERQAHKNEIDALVAHLYGLSGDDLVHILYAPYTFPLVRREVKDGVMAAYRRMGG